MKKICLACLSLLFFLNYAQAKMIMEKKDGAITVESTTSGEIETLFNQYKYEDYTQTRSKFPRIYLNRLPTDWKDIETNDAKRRTFIRILIPLVLKVNEDILQERAEIEKIQQKFQSGEKLNEKELDLLEKKAEKYNIFTRIKGDDRTQILLRRLLKNVDAVPTSIMVSTAAIFTDWGTSRLANDANSLYLEEIWYEDKGLKPLNDEKADYRYRIFSSLEECIAARALKLNSHVNFNYLREIREMSRRQKRPPYGPQLVTQMLKDSNFKNVSGLVDYTFTYYQLTKTDYFPELEDIK